LANIEFALAIKQQGMLEILLHYFPVPELIDFGVIVGDSDA
jgi:hypothetical protein